MPTAITIQPPQFLEPLQEYIQQLITAALHPLQKELALVKSLLPTWVDTKEAMRITGLKQAHTLKVERERPNTLLKIKFEGKTQKSPRYLVASLIEYNASKEHRRHTPRDLGA